MAKRPKKQPDLPGEGMSRPPMHPEVEEAGEDYRVLRDERTEMAAKEREAKAELVRKMEAHAVTTYIYVDSDGVERKLEMTAKKNVKSTKIKRKDPDAPVETPIGD